MKIWITLAFLAIAGSAMAAPQVSKTKVPTRRVVQVKKLESCGTATSSAGGESYTATVCCDCSQAGADAAAFWKAESGLNAKLS
jgi:hypothetical protein